MSKFVTVAKVGETPEGRGRRFSVAGRDVAVFCVGGRYYALDDYCPHMGVSLAEGAVCYQTVVCTGHAWAYQLSDGSCLDAPIAKAEAFEVRVEGDEIRVRVPGGQ